MHKQEELIGYFEFILLGINKSMRRFEAIKTPKDFIDTEEGDTILDAVSMRLQTMGDTLKKVEDADKNILAKYNNVEWNRVMRLRDFISHHYDQLNYEIIFDICDYHLPIFKKAVEEIIDELNQAK